MPDDPGEQFVIDAILTARPPRPPSLVELDAGDDTAIVSHGMLVTTDTLVEGVHWDHRATAADVGWKSVTVSVSDIAAMGGLPTWATLSLCLPRPLDTTWVTDFARGLAQAYISDDVAVNNFFFNVNRSYPKTRLSWLAYSY